MLMSAVIKKTIFWCLGERYTPQMDTIYHVIAGKATTPIKDQAKHTKCQNPNLCGHLALQVL